MNWEIVLDRPAAGTLFNVQFVAWDAKMHTFFL